MKITWSPLAIQRVLEAAEFIARDKPGAAQRWAESTFKAVERLTDLPNSGRVVPEIRRPEVREIIHGAFRIIYRTEDEQVLILTYDAVAACSTHPKLRRRSERRLTPRCSGR